jgi:hypothetical protein
MASHRTEYCSRLAFLTVVLAVQAVSQDQPIRKTGTLEIPQTFCWNLDDGVIEGRGQRCDSFDFWYEAVNPNLRYLVPQHGATLAVAGDKSIGYAGCASANLSKTKINFEGLQKGTFVCAHTSEGRYAEFSIDGLLDDQGGSGTLILRISFTTWER